jgi:hypothetical protein
MNKEQIQQIAEQALSDMCLSVQNQLKITNGDVASQFFDMEWQNGEEILEMIKAYVSAEIQFNKEEV